MRISDWSSDVCSSDLDSYGTAIVFAINKVLRELRFQLARQYRLGHGADLFVNDLTSLEEQQRRNIPDAEFHGNLRIMIHVHLSNHRFAFVFLGQLFHNRSYHAAGSAPFRSEEHTSELQSLMRISYPAFCLKKKKKHTT